ncbi:MAG: FtsB family cell division protein [Coprobacillaceae bacterium]
MAEKKKTGSRGKSRVFLGFGYIVAGIFLIYTLFSSAMSVFQQKEDIVDLEKEKETLLTEKEDLENEVELLNDEDYVTRYAREKYVFTREGERVAIIPGEEE